MAAYKESEMIRKARYEASNAKRPGFYSSRPPRARHRPVNRLKRFQCRPLKQPARDAAAEPKANAPATRGREKDCREKSRRGPSARG